MCQKVISTHGVARLPTANFRDVVGGTALMLAQDDSNKIQPTLMPDVPPPPDNQADEK